MTNLMFTLWMLLYPLTAALGSYVYEGKAAASVRAEGSRTRHLLRRGDVGGGRIPTLRGVTNMEIISCTPDDLADAFAEWQRRCPSGPGLFEPEPPRSPEEYGSACAPYFRELLVEAAEKSADPVRRALARGWTPPAPDYEPFWYHRDHGPVHQEDLSGVLDREEAPEPDGPAPARPGTRMLDLPPSSADPVKQAEESMEKLRRERVDRDVAESAKRGTRSITEDLFEDRGNA